MTPRSFDKRSGVKGPRRERLSEFFDFERWPEKAEQKVTRMELLAVLTRHAEIMDAERWYRRLWRWLTSRASHRGGKDTSEPQSAGGAEEAKPV